MFKWLSKKQKNELNQLPIFKNVEYFDIQVGWFEDIKKIGLEIQEYCDKNNNPYPEITQINLAELKEYDFINETYLANVFEVLENTIETIICVKIKYLNHKY